MKYIYFDHRWCGENGIGRFATEVKKSNVNFHEIPLKGNPAGKLDIFKLTYWYFNKDRMFFSPGYNAPLFSLEKCIITVHDLNHIDLDFNSSFLKRLYYKLVLKRACRSCSKIFTVSFFSKRRIVEWANVDEKKVIVVGNGVSTEFSMGGDKYSPGYKYIFVVGNRKKHKNEERALAAFLESDVPQDVKIIFSGELSDVLANQIDKYNAKERVIFSGRLTNKELAMYYRGAEFLLFPSLYEGFGLPIIESMACGTAVITSNTTSLIEVAGDAAYLVNPESSSEIKNAINDLYFNKEKKDELINKGIKQAANYTWEKTIAIIENELKQ